MASNQSNRTRRSIQDPQPKQIHRVAIYARCSTTHQNTDLQIAELRQYAERRGLIIAGEYVDEGQSGAKQSRPALNRMLADAHAQAFDAVVCWRLDRLGRSLKHLVTTIEDLDCLGIAFVSLKDNLDLSTPSGRLMLHLLAAMAQFERELIKERVISGIRAAQARGVRFGPPRVAIPLSRVHQMRLEGKTWREISKELNVGLATAFRQYKTDMVYMNGSSQAGVQ
jgi:putative DNA-invertase from lambdoid prophage Rac